MAGVGDASGRDLGARGRTGVSHNVPTEPERWLWITPRVSTTLATGALTYSLGLVRAVASSGVHVTVVGLADPSEPDALSAEPELRVEAVVGEPRPAWRSLVSTMPNQAVAGATPELRGRVADLLASQAWDVVVVDGLQVGWVTPLVADGVGDAVRVLVTHNHETSMRREIAAAQPLRSPKKLVLTLEAHKTARLERRMLAAADVVTSITDEDRDRFEHDRPDAEHVVARPGWSGTSPDDRPPIGDRPRTVGIMGSFEWHAKQEGLRRFLDVADPILAAAGVELVVGGRMPDSFRSDISAATSATRVSGWVERPADFMAQCRLGIIAESLGGGFKLKALDYMFHHVPIACLAHCRSGLPLVDGESIVVADDETALAAAIVEWVDRPVELEQLARRAFVIAREEFSWDRSAAALRSAVGRSVTG